MIPMSAGFRHTIRRFRGLLLTGVAMSLGAALETGAAHAQFVARDNTTGNAQGATATGANSTAVGASVSAGGTGSTALGNSANAGGLDSTALGKAANAGIRATAIGATANASGENSIALGPASDATGISTTALGYFADAIGDYSTVLGSSANSVGNFSIALGYSTNTGGVGATALGGFADASGFHTTALGYLSEAGSQYSTAVGKGAKANFINSTALGVDAASTRGSQMMFGTSDNTYTMPGITSTVSLGALSGSGQFVVSDASGNLALTNVTSGRVGIGTFTPDANSRLDIRSNSQTNGVLMKRSSAGAHYLRIEDSSGSTFRCGVQGNGDTQFGALTPGKGLAFVAGGTGKFAINAAGQVSFGNSVPANPSGHAVIHTSGAHLTTGGIWTNNSSRALKQDIEPITSDEARETVRALQPVGYRYKNELDERYVGFIAEDVPELVATRDRKGLASMDITAVLTKVVQDQDRELSDARRMIAELNERLLKLERKLGDTTDAKTGN